jgi:ubiquinone/menaquinone biosynthesis C-methylase UbiE
MAQSQVSHHEANRHFYDRISEAYDFIADANEKKARQTGVAALDLKPGESVLELGFGTGNEVIELAQIVGSAGRVSGIDISSGMLAVAQRKLAANPPAARIDLRVADARQLPFGDGIFDAVYSSFTLELFPDDDVPIVLKECRRVLKPSGRLSVVSMSKPKSGERVSFLEKTYVWMHRHFPHLVDCHPIDVAGTLTNNGFRVVKETDVEIWSLPVANVVATPA